MSRYNSAEFKQLQAEWEAKLKDSGFNDAEELVKGERVLKQNSANVFRQQTSDDREQILGYYQALSTAINQHWFESDEVEKVINFVADGCKIGEAAKLAGVNRFTARKYLRRFEHQYAIRNWTLEEQGLSKPDASYSVIKFAGAELPEQYRNMILAQFLRSLRNGNDYFKLMDSKAYYEKYGEYIKTILSRPNLTVSLAALSDDKDVVLAWSLTESDTLHYVFCKSDYRRHGIARSIMPATVNTVTHLTAAGTTIWTSKYPHAKFDPFN